MAGSSLMPVLPLWRSEADMAVEFFKNLRLPDQVGMPLLRDACGHWFIEIVEALFGSYDRATATRMISEFFILVGKGNSKTTYSAALMLTVLLMNERPNATYFFVAPTKDTAKIAFEVVEAMIKADADLKNRLTKFRQTYYVNCIYPFRQVT